MQRCVTNNLILRQPMGFVGGNLVYTQLNKSEGAVIISTSLIYIKTLI